MVLNIFTGMNTVYLLLGSNQGDRSQWLKHAEQLLEANCGTIIKRSSIYETSAWGLENQPDFLNSVICIHTELSPSDLLNCIHQIEQQSGRQRNVKWGQRTLDMDILLYNNEIINLPGLEIPHPYLPQRRFTLMPLCEIAPNIMHPILKKTMQELLNECPDKLEVRKYVS